jgi:aquaporin Z
MVALVRAFQKRWVEYGIEAIGLCLVMVVALTTTVILFHSDAWLVRHLPDPVIRRFLTGIVMGLTAITFTYSPWGMRSGAHLNPVLTLTFFRLGKVNREDTLFYILAQFIGGISGVLLTAFFLGSLVSDPSVRYATTVPGIHGVGLAFVAELAISFGLMLMVLSVSNSPNLMRFTGVFAGILIAFYITIEAPLSGMSMNPARTLASALPAQVWTGLWIYFTAPLLGMLLAAEVYIRLKGKGSVLCAKIQHPYPDPRCHFNCQYHRLFSHPSQILNDPLPQKKIRL